VNVDGFVATIGSVKKVPICTMAVAYNCPFTFNTYILFFPQPLYIKGMATNLISPFQLRSFGITVNDVPLQHLELDERSTTQHNIQVGDLHIPLELKGVMLGFVSRKPTTLEVTNKSSANGVHVWMTLEAFWNPHSSNPNCIESTLRDSLPAPHATSQLSPLK
jgi:hypothetical protein